MLTLKQFLTAEVVGVGIVGSLGIEVRVRDITPLEIVPVLREGNVPDRRPGAQGHKGTIEIEVGKVTRLPIQQGLNVGEKYRLGSRSLQRHIGRDWKVTIAKS